MKIDPRLVTITLQLMWPSRTRMEGPLGAPPKLEDPTESPRPWVPTPTPRAPPPKTPPGPSEEDAEDCDSGNDDAIIAISQSLKPRGFMLMDIHKFVSSARNSNFKRSFGKPHKSARSFSTVSSASDTTQPASLVVVPASSASSCLPSSLFFSGCLSGVCASDPLP
eukprot:GHVT01072471.1.p2 GENE.GHVT01072471.1~~GHVT01072471.1.p2  ORF type:complete len:166 (+),score=32.33 GHVT01072471.1:733-1230(+)